MKIIGIVFLVFAAFGAILALAGGLRTVMQEGALVTGVGLMRTAQAQLLRYGFHAVSWAGVGICCLGLASASKRKASAIGQRPALSASSAAPEAQETQAPEAQAPASKPAAPIRPASDEPRGQ